MFCQNCGTQLEGGARFCPNCGAAVAAVTDPLDNEKTTLFEEPGYRQPEPPVYQQPEPPVYRQPEPPVYQQPVVTSNPTANALSTPILIFGILGIAFAVSFYLSFLGIIFSAISKSKVKAFEAAGGVLSGKAKVGSILAKVGLIVGIILTVFFVIWLITMIAVAANSSGSYHYYY